MRTKQQIEQIVNLLEQAYPLADCTLDYKKDYELLFSVLIIIIFTIFIYFIIISIYYNTYIISN